MREFKRLADGGFYEAATLTSIPDDMDNRLRREMQELLDAGEAEILPADPPPPAPKPETRSDVTELIDALKTRGVIVDADLPAGLKARYDEAKR